MSWCCFRLSPHHHVDKQCPYTYVHLYIKFKSYMYYLWQEAILYIHTYIILFVINQKWVDHRRIDTDINTSRLLLILLLLLLCAVILYLLLLLISSVYLQSLERFVFVCLHITGRIAVPVLFYDVFYIYLWLLVNKLHVFMLRLSLFDLKINVQNLWADTNTGP